MLSQLKRSLPDGMVERRLLLAELKRHRIITFNASFSPTDEEAIIAIRPTILTIVGEEALAAILDGDAIDEPANDADASESAEAATH